MFDADSVCRKSGSTILHLPEVMIVFIFIYLFIFLLTFTSFSSSTFFYGKLQTASKGSADDIFIRHNPRPHRNFNARSNVPPVSQRMLTLAGTLLPLRRFCHFFLLTFTSFFNGKLQTASKDGADDIFYAASAISSICCPWVGEVIPPSISGPFWVVRCIFPSSSV